MSNNIVTLEPRKPDDGSRVIWTCVCGCTVHYHLADGAVICGSCDRLAVDISGEWRVRYPEEPAEPKAIDGDNFALVQTAGADVFLRRAMKSAESRVVSAILVIFEDGAASTWSPDITTKPRADWLKRQFAKAWKRMTLPEAR